MNNHCCFAAHICNISCTSNKKKLEKKTPYCPIFPIDHPNHHCSFYLHSLHILQQIMGQCLQPSSLTTSNETEDTMNDRLIKLEREIESLQNQLTTTTRMHGLKTFIPSSTPRSAIESDIDSDPVNQFDNDVNDDNKDASFANNINNVNIDAENDATLQHAKQLFDQRHSNQSKNDKKEKKDEKDKPEPEYRKFQSITNVTTTNSNLSGPSSENNSSYICVTTPGGLVVPMHERNIAVSSLERYTGCHYSKFQALLLVTNFPDYIRIFAEAHNVEICKGSSWSCAHCPSKGISILNYNMGSPNAALLVDIVARIELFKLVLFVGMVGGVARKYDIGDFFVPMAAVREEQTSNYYLKPNIPAIPGLCVVSVCCVCCFVSVLFCLI